MCVEVVRAAFVSALTVACLTGCGSIGTAANPSASASLATSHPAAPMPPHGYLGNWTVESVSTMGADGPMIPVPGSATLQFLDNGTVTGFDGVNPWSGRFVAADAPVAQIRIRDVHSGLVGLTAAAPTWQRALTSSFAVIESGAPMRVTGNRDRLTIHVGEAVLVIGRLVG
ncbi:hypothetical protein Back2_28680 [Nocardioides baekrokdamisoli]|uniref:Uncharacterized protein n=2 Tax=Nocardioides baekrokdamisoli TaxID=1804624 RepID=A0A3G9IY28_9ACTN|nr:hypothetical protein Back2_28680 [Nocardioides baekrokdamisoli]